jgi:hypothetical protein
MSAAFKSQRAFLSFESSLRSNGVVQFFRWKESIDAEFTEHSLFDGYYANDGIESSWLIGNLNETEVPPTLPLSMSVESSADTRSETAYTLVSKI